MAQSNVVSAEADERMAWDAVQMSQASAKCVKADVMASMTDSNWWASQERMKRADREVTAAVARYVAAAKAACRARYAAA